MKNFKKSICLQGVSTSLCAAVIASSVLMTGLAKAETMEKDAQDAASDKVAGQVAAKHEEGIGLGYYRTLVDKSGELVSQYKGDKINEQAMKKAKCVVAFPNVTKAAVLVGGRYGDGVASCKNGNGEWSQIAFVDLVGASFGAQLGVKSTDIVALINTDEAAKALKEGKLTFGATASAAWSDASTGDSVRSGVKDVALYSKGQGYFAGAALDGVYIAEDEEALEKYYEEPIAYTQALTTYAVPTKSASEKIFFESVS